MKSILTLLCFLFFKTSIAQCFHQGYKYNIGTELTIDGVKKKCKCIIDVPVGQECAGQWVVVSQPAQTPPPVRPSTPTTPQKPIPNPTSIPNQPAPIINSANTAYVYSRNIQDVETDGFYMNQTSNGYLAANFKGNLIITIKRPLKIHSYNDMTNIEIEGSYFATCDRIRKFDYGGFGGSAMDSRQPLSNDEKNIQNKWIGQKIKLEFHSNIHEDIIGGNQGKIGLKFLVDKNILTRDNNGWIKTEQIDPKQLELKLYFDGNPTNNQLPVKVWVQEKKILNFIFEKISLLTF